MAGHPQHGLRGIPTLCLQPTEWNVALGERPKRRVIVLKDIDLCDTLGRQIHPEFCTTVPLLCVAFSPGIKLQTWAMGVDRRWVSERHWREWIKECGRWQGCHAVYLTEQRGAFFTRMSSTAAKTQMRGSEKTPSSARMTWEPSHHTNFWTKLSSPSGFRQVFNPKLWPFNYEP